MVIEKFELDKAGVGELLNSGEVQAMLAEFAHARCPAGCSVSTSTGKKRASARISADTKQAKEDNLERNTLLKAIGG